MSRHNDATMMSILFFLPRQRAFFLKPHQVGRRTAELDPSCCQTTSDPGHSFIRVLIAAFVAGLVFLNEANAIPPNITYTDVSNIAGLFDSAWPDTSTMGNKMPPGILAADINGDQWPDIFVPQEIAGFPDRLYINNGNGTFTEAAAAWGVDDINQTTSSLFFDYDNDGFLDLVLANLLADGTPQLRLFHHVPNQSAFVDVTIGCGMDIDLSELNVAAGMAAGDLDDDGFLDLVIGFGKRGFNSNLNDTFFRNQGDGTFLDSNSTIGAAPGGRTLQYHFGDFDLDGRPDLIAANDIGTNTRLYQNLGPWSLSNVGPALGIVPDLTDMGVTVGDYDNDGDFDIYITVLSPPCGALPNDPGGNRLFRNELFPTGQLSFVHAEETSGTAYSAWGWGCSFFDVDNDGWQDLCAASANCNSRLFYNLADGTFEPIGPLVGFSPDVRAGGLIAFDYDRDGDCDLLIMARNISPMLFRNDGGNAKHWLTVDPVFEIGNRQAIGTVVRLTVGSLFMMRQITAGTSFQSQEPDEAHFGLAAATQADSVNIVWPDGSFETHINVPADQFVTYRRLQGDFDWDGAVTSSADLPIFVSVLLGQTTTSNELIRADMNFDNAINSMDIQPFVDAMIIP